jgi:dTDP-4-dehydrorhamnose reductase
LKIAVIGANGQLGTDISNAFKQNGDEVFDLDHDEIEISDIYSVSKTLNQIKADIVINTAAMHNVEKCEEEPLQSYEVNAIGA